MYFQPFVLSISAANSKEVFMHQVGSVKVGWRLQNVQLKNLMRHYIPNEWFFSGTNCNTKESIRIKTYKWLDVPQQEHPIFSKEDTKQEKKKEQAGRMKCLPVHISPLQRPWQKRWCSLPAHPLHLLDLSTGTTSVPELRDAGAGAQGCHTAADSHGCHQLLSTWKTTPQIEGSTPHYAC